MPDRPEIAEVLRATGGGWSPSSTNASRRVWFPNKAGRLHKGSPLREVLDEACAAAKLGRRVTPHGLRHTANDLLRRVATGEVVRSIVGHVTTQMTHHYSHVDTAEKTTAATRVLALVRPIETGGKTGGAVDAAGREAPARA